MNTLDISIHLFDTFYAESNFLTKILVFEVWENIRCKKLILQMCSYGIMY